MELSWRVSDEPLTCCEDMAPEAGARVRFDGVVRDHDGGRGVERLVYTAHPDAERFLGEALARATAGRALTSCRAFHRVGELAIGEVALVVVVDAPHRGEAFAAAAAIVDEIKSSVPIWKDQYFVDGTHEWTNCP